MKKENKLKLNKDFRRLYARGKNVACGSIAIYAMKNKKGNFRVGITVGKGVGNAVKRNRAKRIIRAAFDEICADYALKCDLIIVARNRIVGKKTENIAFDLKTAFDKIGLAKKP